MVFKTTCLDRGRALREGSFFFAGIALLPLLDERNLRDRASLFTLNWRAILARIGAQVRGFSYLCATIHTDNHLF